MNSLLTIRTSMTVLQGRILPNTEAPQSERSSSDSQLIVPRLITIINALIFAITSFARLSSHLAITTLELTTLAFIFVMLATSFFWRHKPQDVNRGVVLESKHTLKEIVQEVRSIPSLQAVVGVKPLLMHIQVGDSAYDFSLLRRNDWIVNVAWMYNKHILRCIAEALLSPFRTKSRKATFESLFERKKHRIASDDFPPHSFNAECYCGSLMIMYSGIFLCAWDFYFPTATERVFWQTASVITMAFTLPCGFGLMYLDYVYFGRSKYSRRERGWTEDFLDWLCKVMKWRVLPPTARAGAMEQHLSERPWRAYLPRPALAYCTVMCAFYCLARAYILVEDFIGLRRLPDSVFETVPWTQYLPQI